MKRREFITMVGGAAVVWPIAARAQQPAMPVIGFLSGRTAGESSSVVAVFHHALKQGGYVEGQNVTIEYRWAEGRYDRLPALAADLVRRSVTVIASTGGTAAAVAAKNATASIPIVFGSSDDPVKLGLVASFNRPGGNASGIPFFVSAIEGKRLGLLRELVPDAALIAVLLNPVNPPSDGQRKDVQDLARAMGQRIQIFNASSEREIHAAFGSLVQSRAGGLLVGADPFFNSRREQLVTLAGHYAIPAVYELREFTVAGGLMSYGTSLSEVYWQVGAYTARVLKGERPADLPVVQPTKFELVINLKTAKALGLEVPPTLLARADDVIE
jgi:putative tryptophan/tyrosine transport system substrate-binding protein